MELEAGTSSAMEEAIGCVVHLSKDKQLAVYTDGVYIHSLSKREKNIFLSHDKCVYLFI